jgi:diketogulonate reductase-like aldo/keto reductase
VAARRAASARQVALAFLVRDGVFAIPKAGRAAHVDDNAAAAALSLEPDDLDALERAFPLGPPGRELPTL